MSFSNLTVFTHHFVSAFFLPPLILIWIILAGLWWRRTYLIYFGLFLSYALATPQVAVWLTKPLECYPVATLAQVRHVDAIVVLGGGRRPAPEYGAEDLLDTSFMRLRYAAYLARHTGKPILLTGGSPITGMAEANIMAAILKREYGLHARWVESQSTTTDENAQFSVSMLKKSGVKSIVLVSQGWHLRRAVSQFTQRGLTVLPGPIDLSYTEGFSWLPNGYAMQKTWIALREWIGVLYYKVWHR